jgi:2'-5' RNA ligase
VAGHAPSEQASERPRARLFVALEPPEEVRERIVAWQERELTDPALRPVTPQALHFTLAFLGHLPEDDIEEIAAVLPRDLPAPAMRLAPDPVGVPRGKRPRLFALEAESAGAVEVQAAVSAALEREGFYEPEERPWWPHITVARVRPQNPASSASRPGAGARGSRRPAALKSVPGPLPAGSEHMFVSVRMQLYRSYLRPQGAEYVSLASLELKPES